MRGWKKIFHTKSEPKLLSLEKTPIPIFTNWFVSNCCGQESVSCGTSSPEKINIQLTSIKYQNSLKVNSAGQKYLDNLKALIKIGIRKVKLVHTSSCFPNSYFRCIDYVSIGVSFQWIPKESKINYFLTDKLFCPTYLLKFHISQNF